MDNDLVEVPLSGFEALLGAAKTFDDLIRAAEALKGVKGDTGIKALLSKAANDFALDDVQADLLVRAVAAATGSGLKTIRKTFAVFQASAREAKEKAAAAERAAKQKEYEAAAQKARDEHRQGLWESCRYIAESPDLLAGMAAVAAEDGVVNEVANVKGLYLAFNSRHLVDEAVRVLRTGESSSGKNLVVEKTLKFIPSYAVVQISGSSPKVLPYYNGADPDALKHKIIYIPEAVILAKTANEADNEFAGMFRSLMSEGHIFYQTVVIRADGTREHEEYLKNGPIVAVLTSASDVDYQLKTRCLIQETDESGEQNRAIVKRRLARKTRRTPLNLQDWINFQLWLGLDAPYQVDIPFSEAIDAAFDRWRPGFLENTSTRIRRDTDSFLAVIKASAVLHKAQRTTDEHGWIVAELADYRHAYEAFSGGLSGVYSKVSEKVVAVVRAVEEMQADADLGSVKVTTRDLAERLHLVNLRTVNERLAAAVACGALEQDDNLSGPGGRRYFRVVRKSEDLASEPNANLSAFPPPKIVAEIFSGGYGSGNVDTMDTKDTKGAARARI
jgi:hypothetical protein